MSPRSCWRFPCPFAVNSTTATNVFVAARAHAVVLFADMVEAAVAVAAAVAMAAMALAAIPHRQSCPIPGRVPILV
ncbi:MAG: hypothetical protein WBP56_08240 [Polyangia bacterium]